MKTFHQIMEYLYYKIKRITRYWDTSDLKVHVPLVMTEIIFFYIVDFLVLYRYIIMDYPLYPYKYMGAALLVVSGGGLAIWLSLYFYYRYKGRDERIMQKKTFEHTTSLWAYLFMLTPFVWLLAMAIFYS